MTEQPFYLNYQKRIESVLERLLPPSSSNLTAAIRYATLDAGKRFRPSLVYAVGEMLGAKLDDLDAPAAAVELIHCYSLIHDDLPAMDDDEMRRGKPTCHTAYNEATAILAGDALQAYAFEILSNPSVGEFSHEQRANMVYRLAHACGTSGMVAGQADDVEAEDKTLSVEELDHIHQNKTGALIRACVALGAIAANVKDEILISKLDEYAAAIGLAFQIQDDILDMNNEGNENPDITKPNYANILSLDAAREKAEMLSQQALHTLEDIGDKTAHLRLFAEYVVTRSY